MTKDEFDIMAISNEIRKAGIERLRDIGARIGRDDTISQDAKDKLREVYTRRMEVIRRK